MDAHPAWLDDPQCTGNVARFHDLQKIPQSAKDALQGRALPNFQHYDSGAPFPAGTGAPDRNLDRE
jgi:hypothetical protein